MFCRLLELLPSWFLINSSRSQVEATLRSLLRMAVFFEMDDMGDYAFNTLGSLPGLSPVVQLEVGLLHDIEEWIHAGFRRLVIQVPIQRLQLADFDVVGLRVFFVLAQTQADVELYRRQVCYGVPKMVYSARCPFNAGCRISWKQEWWGGFAKHLLNPDPLVPRQTPQGLLTKLFDVDISYLCTECKKLTIQAALDHPACNGEDQIINLGVKRLGQL